ncbi:hypothetical protein LTS10_008712 [Elasticomyces elasticus]|nr:hypothetical protein LTS10_008712 [Elasticomyces elasticus]
MNVTQLCWLREYLHRTAPSDPMLAHIEAAYPTYLAATTKGDDHVRLLWCGHERLPCLLRQYGCIVSEDEDLPSFRLPDLHAAFDGGPRPEKAAKRGLQAGKQWPYPVATGAMPASQALKIEPGMYFDLAALRTMQRTAECQIVRLEPWSFTTAAFREKTKAHEKKQADAAKADELSQRNLIGNFKLVTQGASSSLQKWLNKARDLVLASSPALNGTLLRNVYNPDGDQELPELPPRVVMHFLYLLREFTRDRSPTYILLARNRLL